MSQQHSEKPTAALVDADLLVYRVGYATELESEVDAKNTLIEMLTTIVYERLQCSGFTAYISGKGNFRYDIAKTVPYKGNRVDKEKPKHYLALRKHLERAGAIVSDGEEADDAIGIASTGADCWLVHVDKDLNQLPGWHYNPVKDDEYYVTEFEGIRSFYTQLLTGDRVDNVQGLKGIGPVKASKILDKCKDEQQLYKAVQDAYDNHNEAPERVLENGQLLWLRREKNQIWTPPSP